MHCCVVSLFQTYFSSTKGDLPIITYLTYVNVLSHFEIRKNGEELRHSNVFIDFLVGFFVKKLVLCLLCSSKEAKHLSVTDTHSKGTLLLFQSLACALSQIILVPSLKDSLMFKNSFNR